MSKIFLGIKLQTVPDLKAFILGHFLGRAQSETGSSPKQTMCGCFRCPTLLACLDESLPISATTCCWALIVKRRRSGVSLCCSRLNHRGSDARAKLGSPKRNLATRQVSWQWSLLRTNAGIFRNQCLLQPLFILQHPQRARVFILKKILRLLSTLQSKR